jgi:hypothetical protein
LQADLLLVNGDPTTNIGDTLSIRGIWRRGERLDRDAKRRSLIPEGAESNLRPAD